MTQSAAKPGLLVLASTYPRWIGDPEPGFVHELCKRLTAQFHVTVVCPHAKGAPERETMEGVHVVRYRYAPDALETLVNDGGIVTNLKRAKWKWFLVPPFVLMQAWAAWRETRKVDIDVVHAHWLIPQGMIAAAIARLSRRSMRYLVTSHGADLYALNGRLLNVMKRAVIRQSAGVTVVSSAMVKQAASIGADTQKIAVIPMGVDLADRFCIDESVQRSRNEILFVGRLVEKKGVRYLLEALSLVKEQIPDVCLTIAGFGPDETALKAQVRALGLDSSVRFTGAIPQTDLPPMYRRAALFVAPFVQAASGDQEGLPVALMEAVACGCPVVAGDIAGIDDLLGDLKSEVCVDAVDVQALAAKICQELAQPENARRRAEQVRAHAADLVDWRHVAARYTGLIDAARSDQNRLQEKHGEAT